MATEPIASFDDLLGVLQRNPEYRARLRQLILDEEFQQLPAQVRGNTERLDALTEQMRLLTERVDALAEQMRLLTDGLTLTEQVQNLAGQMRSVLRRLDRHDRQLSRLIGDEAERRFRQNAGAYFGEILSRIRVIDNNDLAVQVDNAIREGRFNRDERRVLLALDLVLRGRDWDTNEEKCLAVEVSAGVGLRDVERSWSRASLVEKLYGVPVMPVVAGYSISPFYRQLADDRGVQVAIVAPPDAGEPEDYPEDEAGQV